MSVEADLRALISEAWTFGEGAGAQKASGASSWRTFDEWLPVDRLRALVADTPARQAVIDAAPTDIVKLLTPALVRLIWAAYGVVDPDPELDAACEELQEAIRSAPNVFWASAAGAAYRAGVAEHSTDPPPAVCATCNGKGVCPDLHLGYTMVKCSTCKGTGTPVGVPSCSTCGDTKRVFSRMLDLGLGDGPEEVKVPCPVCAVQPPTQTEDQK